MRHGQSVWTVAAVTVFGALSMAAQTLLLRRFLWRFESAETGVALFLSCWLFWSGMGALALGTRWGRKRADSLSRWVWAWVALGIPLYFAEYALIVQIRTWMGVPEYRLFPAAAWVVGCFLANAPFALFAGAVVPLACRRVAERGGSVSRVFAWEALGAAIGGVGVLALLLGRHAPDPRDSAEWSRYFPQAGPPLERFETGGGTTFYGAWKGTFYALTSGGVSETLPESDRAMDIAVLALSQRPYAKTVALVGRVPLAVGVALESLRPNLSVVWCPCDPAYGQRLLRAVSEVGVVATRMTAAGETPQRWLEACEGVGFDVVVVMPPSAVTLEGAAWRSEAFAKRVRGVTARTGVALFALEADAAALSEERAALMERMVSEIRTAWPEGGICAAGTGGWWVAAQVRTLAYDGETAAARFALLKQGALYPQEAVPLVYDAPRVEVWRASCPSLDPQRPVSFADEGDGEGILALGLADALRRRAPELAAGRWLERLKALDSVRLLGLALVALWMLPVAVGRRRGASGRLLAAWLAACGALGLVASLAVLYEVQMRFGVLYVFAGLGSALYLTGVFCGNRVGAGGAWLAGRRRWALRLCLLAATVAQSGVALVSLIGAERLPTALGVTLLCFAVGVSAGLAIPVGLALGGAETAARVAAADAVGPAVGGLAFIAFVPLAGLHGAVASVAMLACGVALGAAWGARSARVTAGLAVLVALAVLGGRLCDARLSALSSAAEPPPPVVSELSSAAAETPMPSVWRGIPRKTDEARFRQQMRDGLLATNEAAFWHPDE